MKITIATINHIIREITDCFFQSKQIKKNTKKNNLILNPVGHPV